MPARALASGLLLALCTVIDARAASLAEQPPRGVDLSGSWRLDPQRSDDTQAALGRLQQQLDSQEPPRGRFTRAQHRADGDGPGEESGERLFHELAIDAQREQHSRQMERYTEILRSPPRIDVEQGADAIHFVADYDRLECEPGEVVAVTDSAGTSQRTCGWSGPALRVLLKGQRGALLERRYELGAGGAELIYTTTLDAEKLARVTLRRVYRRAQVSAGSPAEVPVPASPHPPDAGASPAR